MTTTGILPLIDKLSGGTSLTISLVVMCTKWRPSLVTFSTDIVTSASIRAESWAVDILELSLSEHKSP